MECSNIEGDLGVMAVSKLDMTLQCDTAVKKDNILLSSIYRIIMCIVTETRSKSPLLYSSCTSASGLWWYMQSTTLIGKN